MGRFLLIILCLWIGYLMGYDEGYEDAPKPKDKVEVTWYEPDKLKQIDSLTFELQKYNEGSHMVISQMKDSVVYVPMSNTEEIRRIAEEIRELCGTY